MQDITHNADVSDGDLKSLSVGEAVEELVLEGLEFIELIGVAGLEQAECAFLRNRVVRGGGTNTEVETFDESSELLLVRESEGGGEETQC